MRQQHNKYSFFVRVIAIIALAVSLVSWEEFLLSPVLYFMSTQESGVIPTLVELTKIPNKIYPDSRFEGWLFLFSMPFMGLLAFAFVIYVIRAAINYLNNSEVYITVVWIKITLELRGEKLEHSRVKREQLFHANKPGTEAYIFKHVLTGENGEAIRGSIKTDTTVGNDRITDEIILTFSKRSVEFIETFTRPLQTSFFATYFPSNWVYSLYKNKILFENVMARRVAETSHLNEFNGENPEFKISSPNYPAAIVELEISTPKGVQLDDLIGHRIKDNRVDKVLVHHDTTETREIYTVSEKNLFRETVRLRWNCPVKAV